MYLLLLYCQTKMYLCSAKCCENDNYSMDDVQNCIDKCNSPVTQAQSFMQNELSNFQVSKFYYRRNKSLTRHNLFHSQLQYASPAYNEFGSLLSTCLQRVDFFSSKSLTAMLKSLVTTSTPPQRAVFNLFAYKRDPV